MFIWNRRERKRYKKCQAGVNDFYCCYTFQFFSTLYQIYELLVLVVYIIPLYDYRVKKAIKTCPNLLLLK